MAFFYALLEADARTPDALLTALAPQRARLWASFTGLFGLPRHQVIALTHGSPLEAVPGATIAASATWTPTARPTDTAPLTEPGLYVLRHFAVAPGDVDEFVALSAAAWTDFETDADFAAHPKGLFNAGLDDDGSAAVMLVTWYDGFTSWERSRSPAPDAAENFRRRHELTRGTSAMALRLAEVPA